MVWARPVSGLNNVSEQENRKTMLTNNRNAKREIPGLPIPHRRPLDPQTEMASTGRMYKVVIPMHSGKVVAIEQWSPDNRVGELSKAWGVKATVEVV